MSVLPLGPGSLWRPTRIRLFRGWVPWSLPRLDGTPAVRLVQFGIRTLMVAVAVSALALVVLRGVWSVAEFIIYSPYGLGLSSGLLSPGQAVALRDDFHAAPASQSIRPTGMTGSKSTMYDWGRSRVGEYRIVAGTPGVVTIDPAWDEDSCYEDRPIAVKLARGEHAGLVVAVPRRLLRKR